VDPAALLLVLRQPGRTTPERLDSPALVDDILRHLDAPVFVDWHAPAIRIVLRTGLACAWIAETLARRLKRIDPARAWAAGLLTPLGWYAACALDPGAAAACLADQSLAADPVGAQRRHWAADDATLARRVARRWGLPDWLTAVVGRLGLPAGAATDL